MGFAALATALRSASAAAGQHSLNLAATVIRFLQQSES